LPPRRPKLLDRYHDRPMSEHTERLEDLAERIAAAKEFL